MKTHGGRMLSYDCNSFHNIYFVQHKLRQKVEKKKQLYAVFTGLNFKYNQKCMMTLYKPLWQKIKAKSGGC